MSQNPNAPSMRVRLMKDGKVVRSFKIKPDTFTIGSGQEATVRIGGVPDLAPKHALIWLDEGRPTLVPSSGCTVLVNNSPVKHAQLQPTDIVSLGRLDLQVESLVLGGAGAGPGPHPDEGADEMEAEETQVSSMPYHAPPAAPPPRPAAAPRIQADALPPFEEEEEDEDQATMVAAPQELARLREQSTNQYSLPQQSREAPSPPAQPNYFSEDEMTTPAKPMPSAEALKRPQKYEEMELTEEERQALADLLPFATPVPAQLPGSYNDPGLDDYMSAPSPIEEPPATAGLSWGNEAPQAPRPPQERRPSQEQRPPQGQRPPQEPVYDTRTRMGYEHPVQPQYERPAPRYEQPAQPRYEQPARPQYDQPEQARYDRQPAPAPPRAAPHEQDRRRGYEDPYAPASSPEPQAEPYRDPYIEPYSSPEPAQASVPSSQPASVEAAAPYAPPPRREQLSPPSQDDYYDDEDDYFDDEDDEFSFVEPFSLIDHLVQVPLTSTEGKRESFVAAEVFRHSEGRLWDMVLVRPGQKYRSGPGRAKFIKMERSGQCVVNVPEHAEGTIWINGTEADINTRPPGSDGTRRITLSDGDRALIRTDEAAHLINVCRPPVKTKPSFMFALMSLGVVASFIAGVSGTLIVSLFVVAAFVEETPATQAHAEEEHFEEISQNDLALLAAQELDTPEVEEEEAEPEEEAEQEEIQPEKRVRIARRRSRTTSKGGTATNRLLKALRSGGGGGGAALQDVITNIDSVGSPNAASSLFRSTGIFGAMPGGKVAFARRGTSGGVNTVGGNALKAGNPGLGAIQGKGGKRGKVRGRVSRVSSQARVQGNLDRSEVLRVINGRMGAITRCYEKRLMANPGLSGRLVFAWTVTASGGVSGVSVRSSTLSDPAVAQCISRVIRGMRFPRPDGGAVGISFPFLFRAVDM